MVDAQWYPGFLVGPPDAFHVCQFSTDEHRGRESSKTIPINVPLHGSVQGPKVVAGGRDFHVFHDRLLVLATVRLTSSRSIHVSDAWPASVFFMGFGLRNPLACLY